MLLTINYHILDVYMRQGYITIFPIGSLPDGHTALDRSDWNFCPRIFYFHSWCEGSLPLNLPDSLTPQPSHTPTPVPQPNPPKRRRGYLTRVNKSSMMRIHMEKHQTKPRVSKAEDKDLCVGDFSTSLS